MADRDPYVAIRMAYVLACGVRLTAREVERLGGDQAIRDGALSCRTECTCLLRPAAQNPCPYCEAK